MIEVLQQPIVLVIIFAVVFVLIFIALSNFVRRRRRWMVRSFSINIPNCNQESLAIIESKREEIWQSWMAERTMDRKRWFAMMQNMVSTVASLFHPDEEQPEEKVNLGQLVQQSQRLSTRLSRILNQPAMSVFRDLTIADIEDWYKRINALQQNVLFKTFKSPLVRGSFEVMFMIINTLNPFSLGKRVVSTIGLEVATRYLFSAFFAILAEEAWNTFSQKKHPVKKSDPTAVDCTIALARSMKNLSDEELEFLTRQIILADISDNQIFVKLKDLQSGFDKGKNLKQLLLIADTELPLTEMDPFIRLRSGDELAKLHGMQALRAHARQVPHV
jgi:hypothetical protein